MVPVGVGKTGWKGVGVGKSAGWKGVAVGLGSGLAVTKVNGREAGLAGADPQAERAVSAKRLRRSVARWSEGFIDIGPAMSDLTDFSKPVRSYHNYGLEVWVGKAVIVAVAVGVPVGGRAVGDGEAVAVPVAVRVGVAVEVETGVLVCVAVEVRVMVGKTIETGVSVAVAVARGVRVGTFGTQILCPTARYV
jgi:hypothetical protein